MLKEVIFMKLKKPASSVNKKYYFTEKEKNGLRRPVRRLQLTLGLATAKTMADAEDSP